MSEKDKDLEDQKRMQMELIYYSNLTNVWIQSRMEIDKQLLTLSSLAIGLLVILGDNWETCLEIVLFFMTGFLFISVILILLIALRINSKYIEHILNKDSKKEKILEKRLEYSSFLAFYTFVIAVIFSFILTLIKLI